MITSVNSTVCVVDPTPDDYRGLIDSASDQKNETHFEFVRSGRDALRFNARSDPDLWIINMKLPDMSGVDLQEMIHTRYPGVPCYLVGDDYRPEDEIDARQGGATMYFCKPLRSEWVLSTSNNEK